MVSILENEPGFERTGQGASVEEALRLRLPQRIIKQSVARILRKQRVRSRFKNTFALRCGQPVREDVYVAIEIGKKN